MSAFFVTRRSWVRRAWCLLALSSGLAVGVAQTTAAPKSSEAALAPAQSAVPMTESQKRQAEMAADTAKLQVLATELKAEMDKSSKDTLSLAVMRKADEIERLARKVRMEMKASLGN